MTETVYTVTASFYSQVVDRHDDGTAKRYAHHRRGDTITGLTELEVERLTRAGAIRPADAGPVEPAPEVVTAPPADTTGAGAGEDDSAGGDDNPPGRPKRTAKTEDWQEYAVSQGMSPEEAAQMSRSDLIEKYGD